MADPVRPPNRVRISSRTRLFNDPNQQDQKMSFKSINLGTFNPFSQEWDHTQRKRLGVFIMCVLVGLASGSNYVYSAYAPQLATKLVVSSTIGNLIGLAGNLGVYLTGPLWGKIVDSRGQRIPLFVGGLCCLIGYSTVHAFYIGKIQLRSNLDSEPNQIKLFILEFAMFLTGCGGSSGLTSAVNATAKSFSNVTRASASGTVLAGFGLSAFLFSSLGNFFYNSDAGGLLFLLSIGTSIPMLLGSIFIKPIPPIEESINIYQPLNNQQEEEQEDEHEETNGIPKVIINQSQSEEFEYNNYSDEESQVRSRTSSLELTRSKSPISRGRHTQIHQNHHHAHFNDNLPPPINQSKSKPNHLRSTSLASLPPTAISYSPLDLMKSIDFWILFICLALLCGTGLMYINNAGTVTLALGRENQRIYDKAKIGGYQAKQVGLVSIWNCGGRIIGGVVSDFGKNKFGIRRVWFLPVVAVLFIISQISALETTHVQSLWMVSTLLGLAYGSLFNVLPMLILEWFGMRHFSQNWGWVAVAPVLGGNAFNLLFGKVYDSHTIGKIGTSDELFEGITEVVRKVLKRDGGAIPDDGKHDCLVGEECYGIAFKISTIGNLIALALSIWVGIRREKISKERKKLILASRGEIVSDEEV
ncbi:uncharacterized protein I206_101358 [Kwoniella pini CBS 10737]|uniref:Nodulin-like domain-containing protein n=1 Tax=Kwoniella pini CBS 10737 TaxID=1296096 RepID=A0A1B9HWX4_9TREE|nr:uncharacterized protein I206_06673 [Kwoniella pini CBS 10737]OCF47766.1 hypothetical protein I206_06673 [Kwoniella pini CBS 10737]